MTEVQSDTMTLSQAVEVTLPVFENIVLSFEAFAPGDVTQVKEIMANRTAELMAPLAQASNLMDYR